MRIMAYSSYRQVDWAMTWQQAKQSSLRSQLTSIVAAIEQAAVDLVAKLEEAERRAEIAHRNWLAEQEQWRREEDRRRVETSREESGEQLGRIIQSWSKALNVEAFLAGVESRASMLGAADREQVLERLALARDFLGGPDPLEFFLSWKTPEERYRPAFPDDDGEIGG